MSLVVAVSVSVASLGLQAVASLTIGAGVFLLARWVLAAMATEDLPQGDEWRYDVSRINELRKADVLYRLTQPLIWLLARVNRQMFRDGLPKIQQEIQAAGLPRFWLPEEYLGRCQVIALCAAPVFAYFLVQAFGAMNGLLASALAVLATAWLLRRHLAAQAAYRLRLIKRRMPFLLDLLTLLMEAGSTFLAALGQAVEEFRGHPVAEEFAHALADMSLGKTRTEAFHAMRDRLHDDEITSILGAIVQGEQLGTPLATIFRTQADILRIKRSQRAETIAGEAGVNMLLPMMLVMISTVLIILGPFLMNYLYFGLSL